MIKRSLLVFLTGLAISSGGGCDSATKKADGGGTGGHVGGQSGEHGPQSGGAGASAGGAAGVAGAAGAGGWGGGAAGDSGVSGSGGSAAGASGQSGHGGADPIGSGGQGGQPMDGGQTCARLVNEFQDALTAARICVPGAANQCHQLAPIVLADCPACSEAWVNDATALIAIQEQWLAACARPLQCKAVSCGLVLPSSCASSSPTTAGPGAGASAGGSCTVD